MILAVNDSLSVNAVHVTMHDLHFKDLTPGDDEIQKIVVSKN